MEALFFKVRARWHAASFRKCNDPIVLFPESGNLSIKGVVLDCDGCNDEVIRARIAGFIAEHCHRSFARVRSVCPYQELTHFAMRMFMALQGDDKS